MQLERACNLDIPSGATPMTIADAIIRATDNETLEEVLYYIDCFLNTRNTDSAPQWFEKIQKLSGEVEKKCI